MLICLKALVLSINDTWVLHAELCPEIYFIWGSVSFDSWMRDYCIHTDGKINPILTLLGRYLYMLKVLITLWSDEQVDLCVVFLFIIMIYPIKGSSR